MTICRLSWGCASIQWDFLKLGTSILYGIPAAHGSAVLLLNTNPSLKSLVMRCRPRGWYRTGTPPCGHTRVVQLLMICISSIRLGCHLCLPYNSRACLKASVLVFRPKFGDFRFDDSVFEPVQIYFQRELKSNHCPQFWMFRPTSKTSGEKHFWFVRFQPMSYTKVHKVIFPLRAKRPTSGWSPKSRILKWAETDEKLWSVDTFGVDIRPAGRKFGQFRPKRQFWGFWGSKVNYPFLAQKNRLDE